MTLNTTILKISKVSFCKFYNLFTKNIKFLERKKSVNRIIIIKTVINKNTFRIVRSIKNAWTLIHFKIYITYKF